MSRSTTMLMALAPPAASVPPSRTNSTSLVEGQPFSASTITGTVVMSNNSTTRNLARAMYPPTFVVGVREEPCTTPPGANREGTRGRAPTAIQVIVWASEHSNQPGRL